MHQPADSELLGDAHFIAATQLDEELREEDRQYLAKVAERPELAGLNPITALLTGPVAASLERYIRTCAIDMVVMSTHGRGGLSRAWYGSVADELIRTSNVPVMLLRPDGIRAVDESPPRPGMHNVLLPVDGSEYSQSLIEIVTSIGGTENTHYTLLHVVITVAPVVFGDGIGVVTPMADGEVIADAERKLEQLASSLRSRGFNVDTAMVMDRDVAAAIRTYAIEKHIDLVAMVTHGRSGWKRLALGSISDQIVRGTHVPLLVLHPAGSDAPTAIASNPAALDLPLAIIG